MERRSVVPAMLLLLVTVVFLTGCINPLGGGSSSSEGGSGNPESAGGPGDGTLTVILSNFGASTVAPGSGALAANTAYYSILLEDPAANFADISRANILPGEFPFTVAGVPATTWDVTVRAYNSSDQLLGSSAPTSVIVTGAGGA